MSVHAKAAKDALDLAVTDLKRSKTRINNALAAPPPNTRTISSKMKQLTEALSSLNTHDTAWVSKSGLTDEQLNENRYSHSWLEAEWASVDAIQDQVDELLFTQENRTEDQTVHILKSQMDTLQHDISTKTCSLLEKTAAPTNDTDP